MAARQPPIIRTSNEDLLKDVCALSQLLEHQCLDKTKHGHIYISESKQCHLYGLDAYRSHHDYFEETLGQVFFKTFNVCLDLNKTKGTTKFENFRHDFDCNLAGNTVKSKLEGDLSPIVDRFKIQIIDAMITDLTTTCNQDGSSMAMFLVGKAANLTTIKQAILQSNVIKAVQVGFTVIVETKMYDLFELNVKFGAME